MTTKLVATIAVAGMLLLPSAARTQTPDAAIPSALSMVTQGGWVPVRGSTVAPLKRLIAVGLTRARISEALDQIGRRGGVRIAYGDDVLAAKQRVTLDAEGIPVVDALIAVLEGTGLEAYVSLTGSQVLVRGAQGGSIAGRVADSLTGRGIEGALVSVEGTRWTVRTDTEGRYRFADVTAGSHTLSARRLAYARSSKSVTVVQGEEVTADFALQPVPSTLNEVVVTATGEQRRLELGHVVGTINADSIVKAAPVSSLSELLGGRVPGLQVFQSQGTVGGEVRLRVRSPNSLLLTTQPILIVDGVRYTSRAVDRDPLVFVSSVEPTSPLNDINPNDIETIEVVKGPSAATLYGTDAANGVLVVTTKRGTAGEARWNAYAKGTSTSIPEARFSDPIYGWSDEFGTLNSCGLWAQSLGSCTQDSVVTVRNPLNDPALTIFSSKPRWEYGANASGGRQDFRYYLAGDFENATGPLQMPSALAESLAVRRGTRLPDEQREPNAFTKMNLRANVTWAPRRTMELRASAGYSQRATRTLSGGLLGNPYSEGAFMAIPSNPYGRAIGSPTEYFSSTSTERVQRFLGSASGEWRPATLFLDTATPREPREIPGHAEIMRRYGYPHPLYPVGWSLSAMRPFTRLDPSRRRNSSGEAEATCTPASAASFLARSTLAALTSVARTRWPRAARPIACVPIPHAQSSTSSGPSPRIDRSRRSSTAPCRLTSLRQSAKVRWYDAASRS